MRGTKEFHDMRYQFEKDVGRFVFGHKMDREAENNKTPKHYFYQDGRINDLFHLYMCGYQFGKCI